MKKKFLVSFLLMVGIVSAILTTSVFAYDYTAWFNARNFVTPFKNPTLFNNQFLKDNYVVAVAYDNGTDNNTKYFWAKKTDVTKFTVNGDHQTIQFRFNSLTTGSHSITYGTQSVSDGSTAAVTFSNTVQSLTYIGTAPNAYYTWNPSMSYVGHIIWANYDVYDYNGTKVFDQSPDAPISASDAVTYNFTGIKILQNQNLLLPKSTQHIEAYIHIKSSTDFPDEQDGSPFYYAIIEKINKLSASYNGTKISVKMDSGDFYYNGKNEYTAKVFFDVNTPTKTDINTNTFVLKVGGSLYDSTENTFLWFGTSGLAHNYSDTISLNYNVDITGPDGIPDGKDDVTGEDISHKTDILANPLIDEDTPPDSSDSKYDGVFGPFKYMLDTLWYWIGKPFKWLGDSFKTLGDYLVGTESWVTSIAGFIATIFGFLPAPIVALISTGFLTIVTISVIRAFRGS